MSFQELRALAEQTSPASVSDVMAKMGHHHQHEMIGAKAQTPTRTLFAEAVTLRSLPMRADLAEDAVEASGGDPLTMAFDQAVEATTEGKVMVVDVSGWRDATIGGGTKYSRLADTGAAGLVTDGLIRDSDELVNYGYAVYCAGFSPRSGTRNFLYPHDFNVPVTCGGALVRPGDYLIGDADGIVVLPRKWADKVLKMAVMKEKLDVFIKEKIKRENIPGGTVYPPTEAVLQEFAAHIGVDRSKLPL